VFCVCPGTRNLKPVYNPTPVVAIVKEDAPHYERRVPTDFRIECTVPTPVNREAAPEKVKERMHFYEEACEHAGIDAGDLQTGDDGSYKYIIECPNYKEHTTGGRYDACVWISPSGAISFGCFHAHCADKKWQNYYRPFLEEQAKAKGFQGSLKFGESSELEMSTSLTSTPNLEVRDVGPKEQTENPLVLPASALDSTVFGDLYDEVFQQNDWCLELAIPAFIAVGGVLVPETPKADGSLALNSGTLTHSYTALIGGVNVGKSQITEWAAKSVGIYDETRGQHYCQTKFGSAEQMWKYLNRHRAGEIPGFKDFHQAVLVNPDEWAHVMAKAGIPDSSFASTLTTAYYNRRHTVTVGGSRGGHLEIPFAVSIIGGIVEDEFSSVMNASTIGGLYDRITFGLAPKGFVWNYRPFPYHHPLFKGKGSLSIKPVPVTLDGSVFEVSNAWKERDPSLGRIVEICVRAAAVFASIDGRNVVTGADVEKLWPFAMYQKAIRGLYRPNPGRNPDAIYSNVALGWIKTHAQQWRTIKDLKDGTNFYRRQLGPKVCFHALQALAREHEIEVWVSTADGNGQLNPLPPDYTGKRPKPGSGLVRIARSD